MLQSRYRRAGSPVLLAFGPESKGDGTMQVGILFVSAQLDRRPYPMYDPDAPDGDQVTVNLPDSLIDRPSDVLKTNVTLEVT